MNYKTILSLDPSGNFNEGKGTTGWCIYDCQKKLILDAGSISSKDFISMEEYWHKHLLLMEQFMDYFKHWNTYTSTGKTSIALVVEDYLVYANKATAQTYSRMETPKLIGILQYFAYMYHVPFFLQRAVDVKTRWSNEILIHKGIIAPAGKGFIVPDNPDVKPTRHTIDAIRHAVHFASFKNGDNKA